MIKVLELFEVVITLESIVTSNTLSGISIVQFILVIITIITTSINLNKHIKCTKYTFTNHLI